MKNKLVFNTIDMDLLERTMWKEKKKKLTKHTILEKKKKKSIIEEQKEKRPQGIKKEQPQN